MDFEGLKKCWNRLGTGAVIDAGQKTCLPGATPTRSLPFGNPVAGAHPSEAPFSSDLTAH
jgi:hypothetical protein